MDLLSPVAFELELPVPSLTNALRLKIAHVEITEEDTADGWSSDEYLNRFLIARSGDTAAAAKMYEITMRYRSQHGFSRLIDTYDDPRVMHMCFSGGFVGVDREGFPISIERLGNADAAGIHASVLRAAADAPAAATPLDPFVKWMAWNHEVQERVIRRWCARTGRNRGRITFIADLGGVSLRHLSAATIAVLKSKADLEVAHYPEIVRRVFLINTPQVVLPVWAAIKLVLDKQIVDKYQILGTGFLPELLKYIAPEALPASLGGTLHDDAGDPDCKRLIGGGGAVPLAYVVGVATDGRGLGEVCSIPARTASEVLLAVPAGARIEWRWGVESYDITFSAEVCMAVPPALLQQLPPEALRVESSLRGVHTLGRGYTGPIPHFCDSPHPPTLAPSPAAIAVTWTVAVPPARLAHACGSWTVPQAAASGSPQTQAQPQAAASGSQTQPAGGTATPWVLVRLVWDNRDSWMYGKTLSRRIDVILTCSDPTTVPVEADPAAAVADARAAHTARFGSGSDSDGTTVLDPPGTPVGLLS